MTIFRRLFSLMSTKRHWIAIGALLAFLAVGANVALMGLSAYLISKAALVSNVAEVALAITGVRVRGPGSGGCSCLPKTQDSRPWTQFIPDLGEPLAFAVVVAEDMDGVVLSQPAVQLVEELAALGLGDLWLDGPFHHGAKGIERG
jgi:hypothetical protein